EPVAGETRVTQACRASVTGSNLRKLTPALDTNVRFRNRAVVDIERYTALQPRHVKQWTTSGGRRCRVSLYDATRVLQHKSASRRRHAHKCSVVAAVCETSDYKWHANPTAEITTRDGTCVSCGSSRSRNLGYVRQSQNTRRTCRKNHRIILLKTVRINRRDIKLVPLVREGYSADFGHHNVRNLKCNNLRETRSVDDWL